MLRRLVQPHSILVTLATLLFIWGLNSVRLNLHYLDPFNNGLKEYEITDIVYAFLGQDVAPLESRIVVIDSGRPDRTRIAALVDRLTAAGAGAIGLDFYFDTVTGVPADTLLQNSLRRSDQVVLACALEDEDQTDDAIDGFTAVDTFFSNYAPIGYGNFPSNATKTIRVFSPGEETGEGYVPAFTTALLEKYDPAVHARLEARKRKLELIHYSGHKDNFISLSLPMALDSLTEAEARATFQNKIVLVGYAPEDEWANPLLDRHYTPINKSYNLKSIPDMFGIVIHANVLSMVLNERYVREVPKWLTLLLSLLLCYVNVVVIRWIYKYFHEAFHGVTRALQLVEFIALFFFIAVLFYYFRVKLDLGVGILAVLLAYDFIMIYETLVRPRAAWLRDLPEYPLLLSEEEE
ncbi:MAG: CHASE2 domain-containing protein [Bacteroidota bacterium]